MQLAAPEHAGCSRYPTRSVEIRAHSQIACTQFGVRATMGPGLPFALDIRQNVGVADSEIRDADTGIEMASAEDPSPLSVQGSHITGRINAIAIRSNQTVCDLGTAAQPGHNELTSPGIAYRDFRSDPEGGFETCDAVGTTLNGRSYAGQLVDGPASAPPDYQLNNAGVSIQF